MPEITRAKYAATAPWSGITGKPTIASDISQLSGEGFANGQVPVWNSALGKFVPGNLSGGGSSGDTIAVVNTPGTAVRRFSSPGGGTAVNQWFREVFDVRHYGAQGNGSDADTSAILAAIADLETNGGGSLYFPKGTYSMAYAPPPLMSPLFICGDGPGVSTLLIGQSGFDMGPYSFGARDISFISDGSSLASEYCVYLSDGSGISDGTGLTDGSGISDYGLWIESVTFTGFHTAVWLDAPSSFAYISRAQVCPGVIGMNVNCREAYIDHIRFENDSPVPAIGLYLNGGAHQISACRFLANGSNWDRCIVVDSGISGVITDCLFDGVDSYAIDFTDGSGACESWRVANISLIDVLADPPINFDPLVHYVNDIFGVSGNTSTLYNTRKELSAEELWDPGTITPGGDADNDFTVMGARSGDQAIYGSPYELTSVSITISVPSDDTVHVNLHNASGAPVSPGEGLWTVRVFH